MCSLTQMCTYTRARTFTYKFSISQHHHSQACSAIPLPYTQPPPCYLAHQCQCQKSSSWPPRMPWTTPSFLIWLCYFLFILHITEVWISNAFSFTWENWRKPFVPQKDKETWSKSRSRVKQNKTLIEIIIFNDLEPKLIWMNPLQTLPIHFPNCQHKNGRF